MARKLFELNANSCCVCKRTGVGLNLHHIDGDSSNTTVENLAVLCVNEHDAHHRPNKYPSLNHMDLSSQRLLIYKKEWERFVQECKKDNPQILATINAFGTYDNIVGMKIIFQWLGGRIVFERSYQQLDGNLDYWTDKAIEEVSRFGEKIKIVMIDKPLKIEFCNNDKVSLSRTLDEPAARKVIADDWREKSIATVYVNPERASLSILIFYKNEEIMYMGIHRCGNRIKYIDYKGVKSAKVKRLNVRKQVNAYIQQLLDRWSVGMIFYGTGNPDNPRLTEKCELPVCWEVDNTL
ncbi:HNH endonuclease [Ruminococcus sp. OA3]|uniref:HNH endonuclease signature motif containing protein n=1 Tax=Ruminococcus sp. OA3 TaxID=2914164 RepID=UPI001F05DE9A|nr:HNH endonuclease signature motif containing protein [Ruminococcus sp. OA3]MCH1981250.1 HNH endonuclease [Ruminococcus sp. OA3]